MKKCLVGEIELIPYDDVVIVCKKIRENLKPNIYITTKFLSIGETIRGNIIIVCKEFEKFKSLSKEQSIKYAEFLKNASFHYDNNTEKLKKLSIDTKFLKNITKDKTLYDYENNFKNQDEDVLRMILGIQTVILKYIQNNID